jgi:hypothetical protein
MTELSPADDRSWRSTSQRALSGRVITPHRALRRLTFAPVRIVGLLVLPVLFDLLVLKALDPVARAWAAFFAFCVEKLELAGSVTLQPVDFGWFVVQLPNVALPSMPPDTVRWVSAVVLSATVWLGARLVPDAIAPLRYFLRSVAFVQLTAVAYFLAMPAEFPYNVALYLDGSSQMAVWLVLVIPWVHALVYYIFDFALWKKAALTALTLAFIAIALPLQMMVHAVILVHGSLLLMPLLFFLFGTWLLLLPCVALYGWAMSWWRPSSER